jgi:hypothetical protein
MINISKKIITIILGREVGINLKKIIEMITLIKTKLGGNKIITSKANITMGTRETKTLKEEQNKTETFNGKEEDEIQYNIFTVKTVLKDE